LDEEGTLLILRCVWIDDGLYGSAKFGMRVSVGLRLTIVALPGDGEVVSTSHPR